MTRLASALLLSLQFIGHEKSYEILCKTFGHEAKVVLESLKKLYLHNPYILTLPEVGDAKDEIVPKNVQQFWIQCSDRDKLLHILALLKLDLVQKKVLIFTNTIDTGFRLKLFLEQFGIKSAVLNAELPINSRVHILEDDYQHEMIKKYGPDTSTHPLGDIEIWERCVGGRKRGRMFGVGTSMDPSYVITGLLSGSSTGKSYAGSSSSEVQELKEKLQKIEEERAIEREENARREEENMDLIYVAMLARQYPPPPSDDPTSRDPPFFRQDDMDLIYVSLVIPFSVV
ncbi:hypothetical protein L6452_19695 [Arctium lappa]|uniref:Uncharacterized protein n=1 Tax=Arctium lappa TaxID=4217 RepID=A0ACB9BAN2_ARCLA|nr:hypothetical protein L6452_19695 [Arctium lappa]